MTDHHCYTVAQSAPLAARRFGRTFARIRGLFITLIVGLCLQQAHVQAEPETPDLSVQIFARLAISGTVGSNYLVQCVTDLSQTNHWQTLTNIVLPTSPYFWFDQSSPATAKRFYRVALAEVPANPDPNLLVWIPPGTFLMGSPTNQAERNADETQHWVTLTRGFYMSKYEVTQERYLAVMGTNPSHFNDSPNLPVERVLWSDATNYCARLTQRERAAGRLPAGWAYRLPTEAEWEYACRAGTTNAFYFGDSITGERANFNCFYEYDAVIGTTTNLYPVGYFGRTRPVGSYPPNPWGLYDMCGNVWELCLDWYSSFSGGTIIDPTGPSTGIQHVMRGCSWDSVGKSGRSAHRGHIIPENDDYRFGFRPVLAPAMP